MLETKPDAWLALFVLRNRVLHPVTMGRLCGKRLMTVKPGKPENASFMSWLGPAGWWPDRLSVFPSRSFSHCVVLGRFVTVSGLCMNSEVSYAWVCSVNLSSHPQVPVVPNPLTLPDRWAVVLGGSTWKKALLNGGLVVMNCMSPVVTRCQAYMEVPMKAQEWCSSHQVPACYRHSGLAVAW